jgi:hypothetical protein
LRIGPVADTRWCRVDFGAIMVAGDTPTRRCSTMAMCEVCHNVSEHPMQIRVGHTKYLFDCFECAIQKLAPVCRTCGCRVIGHATEMGAEVYCSTHCAQVMHPVPALR